jgi:glycosyltransferase involved in cell wall biosynthesis
LTGRAKDLGLNGESSGRKTGISMSKGSAPGVAWEQIVVKILVVHSELGVLRGGGENFTRNVFSAFVERGHDVSAVFVADSKGRYPIALPSKIQPIPIAGYWSRKFGQKTLSTMGRLLPEGVEIKERWDRMQKAVCWRIVRWHDHRFTNRINRELASRWKEFDAVYVHGSPALASSIALHRPTVLRLPGPVSPEWASALHEVHAVCANGDAFNQIQRFLGDHIIELPVGLDADVFKPGPTRVREQLGWTKEHWVIGYVGRLAHVKGVDLLAEAFRQMLQSEPQVRLLIIGSGEEETKLRAKLVTEINKGVVHIELDISHESLAEWYRGMDLFVMPSRYENYSNAVLEALACGVPFLVSDIGGNRSLTKTHGGWFFRADSVDSLVHSLNFIVKDSSFAKVRGVIGREKVRQNHSWRTSAQRLEGIIRSCLKRKAGTICRQ